MTTYEKVFLNDIRFLLTRILLLRPLLLLSTSSTQLQALGGTGQETLDRDIIYRCCELCVRTACLLVDALHKNLGTLYRSYGWHCVYCRTMPILPQNLGTSGLTTTAC